MTGRQKGMTEKNRPLCSLPLCVCGFLGGDNSTNGGGFPVFGPPTALTRNRKPRNRNRGGGGEGRVPVFRVLTGLFFFLASALFRVSWASYGSSRRPPSGTALLASARWIRRWARFSSGCEPVLPCARIPFALFELSLGVDGFLPPLALTRCSDFFEEGFFMTCSSPPFFEGIRAFREAAASPRDTSSLFGGFFLPCLTRSLETISFR